MPHSSSRTFDLWARKDEFIKPNSVAAYMLAAVCVAIATAIRWAVYPYVNLLFPTYYVAVLIVSLVGGFFVSVFAIVLSALAAWWFFMPHSFEFDSLTSKQAVNLVFFAGMSLAIAAMGNFNRILLDHLKKRGEQSQLLLTELRHRGKNTLMVVQAVIVQTVTTAIERETLLGRIASLAIVDELRSSPEQQFVDLQMIAKRQLASFNDQVSMQGPPVPLDSILIKVVVLILNELMTNAVKYGALSQSGGRVFLTWFTERNVAHISWREAGGPSVTPPNSQGTGLTLIERLLKTAGGELMTQFKEDGILHNMTIHLRALEINAGRQSALHQGTVDRDVGGLM